MLGVDISEIAHANTVHDAEVHGPGGLSFRVGLGAATGGVTARRSDFDDLLVRRARDVGVEMVEDARFVGFVEHADGVEVRLRDAEPGAEWTLGCGLLVGADGANSRVRRAAGISPPQPHKTSIAIRCYAEISPPRQRRQDRVELPGMPAATATGGVSRSLTEPRTWAWVWSSATIGS